MCDRLVGLYTPSGPRTDEWLFTAQSRPAQEDAANRTRDVDKYRARRVDSEQGFLPWVNRHSAQCINRLTGRIHDGAPPGADTKFAPAQCASECSRVTSLNTTCLACLRTQVLAPHPNTCGVNWDVNRIQLGLQCLECVGGKELRGDKAWACIDPAWPDMHNPRHVAVVVVGSAVGVVLVALLIVFIVKRQTRSRTTRTRRSFVEDRENDQERQT